jgi:hypothetical protein
MHLGKNRANWKRAFMKHQIITLAVCLIIISTYTIVYAEDASLSSNPVANLAQLGGEPKDNSASTGQVGSADVLDDLNQILSDKNKFADENKNPESGVLPADSASWLSELVSNQDRLGAIEFGQGNLDALMRTEFGSGYLNPGGLGYPAESSMTCDTSSGNCHAEFHYSSG